LASHATQLHIKHAGKHNLNSDQDYLTYAESTVSTSTGQRWKTKLHKSGLSPLPTVTRLIDQRHMLLLSNTHLNPRKSSAMLEMTTYAGGWNITQLTLPGHFSIWQTERQTTSCVLKSRTTYHQTKSLKHPSMTFNDPEIPELHENGRTNKC